MRVAQWPEGADIEVQPEKQPIFCVATEPRSILSTRVLEHEIAFAAAVLKFIPVA